MKKIALLFSFLILVGEVVLIQKKLEIKTLNINNAETSYLKEVNQKIFEAKPSPDFDDNKWLANNHNFVIGKKWYPFFTHAHRHYTETIVLVPDPLDYFDYKQNDLTTLFDHATEIFDYKGKTYSLLWG